MEKVAKNGRKVKGIVLLFCCFPIYVKWKHRLKMDEKLRLHKWPKNSKKVRLYPLLFCCFLSIDEKWKKSLKMDEK